MRRIDFTPADRLQHNQTGTFVEQVLAQHRQQARAKMPDEGTLLFTGALSSRGGRS